MGAMPSSEKSVSEDSAPAPKKAPAKKKHAVAFDDAFPVPSGTETVSISVAGAKAVTLPVDGSPVEVSAKDAKILVASPAVKKVDA